MERRHGGPTAGRKPGPEPAAGGQSPSRDAPKTPRGSQGRATGDRDARGGGGAGHGPGPPPKKPRINPRTRLSATWRGGQAEEKRRNACKHYTGRRGGGGTGAVAAGIAGGEEEEKARGGGSRPGKGTAKPPDPGPSDAIHTPPEQPLSPLSSHPRVTRQGHQPPAR